jgi:hypothetical protein
MDAYYFFDALLGERVMHAPGLFIVRSRLDPLKESRGSDCNLNFNESQTVYLDKHNEGALFDYERRIIQSGPLLEEALENGIVNYVNIQDGLKRKIEENIRKRKINRAAEIARKIFLSYVLETQVFEEISTEEGQEEDGN